MNRNPFLSRATRMSARTATLTAIVLALTLVTPQTVSAWTVLRMDAPTFSSTTNLGTAYIETNTGAASCNDPYRTNCFNGYLELQIRYQGQWLGSARIDAPTSISADGTRYWWRAQGTCWTLASGLNSLYRTYFQQSYVDQGSLVLPERQWSNSVEHACAV